MRFPVLALAAFLPAAASAQSGAVDAGRGPVPIYVPASYDPGTPAPLVILLHALGHSGQDQENDLLFAPLVDAYGFLYVHPDGLTSSTGAHYWNATDSCCDWDQSGSDDVGYLMSLLSAVRAQYNVDSTRVYLVGSSNGGFMAYRMACEHAESFAAIVSLAGATWSDPLQCTGAGATHVLQIHGTNDTVIRYDGGLGPTGVPYPGAVPSVEYWAGVAGCSLVPDDSAPSIDLDTTIPGNETTVRRYVSGCSAAGSAELWTIVGGTHAPWLPADFAARVLDWCYAHPKPCGTIQRYCTPTTNSTGFAAFMGWTGSLSVSADNLYVSCWPMPLNSSAVFIYSPDQVQVPLGNGNLCVGTQTLGFVVRMQPVVSDGSGLARAPVDFDNPTTPQGRIYPSTSWNFSCWYRDPAAGGSFFNFADGLRIVFCP